jgi:hypothetical protein
MGRPAGRLTGPPGYRNLRWKPSELDAYRVELNSGLPRSQSDRDESAKEQDEHSEVCAEVPTKRRDLETVVQWRRVPERGA